MNALLVIFFISYTIYAFVHNRLFMLVYFVLLGIYYYLTQIKFFKTNLNGPRTKSCIATWGGQTDPFTYVKVKLNISKIEKYLEEQSKTLLNKITLTTFVIKLMSLALKKFPQLNGCIRFGKVLND